jgi:hypothetical protein
MAIAGCRAVVKEGYRAMKLYFRLLEIGSDQEAKTTALVGAWAMRLELHTIA